jgi:hypothetical protein
LDNHQDRIVRLEERTSPIFYPRARSRRSFTQ